MAKPTIEGLPTELKTLILFEVLDYDALKSLVFASPKYHDAYLTVRPELLGGLVKRQYSGFLDLAEALTAVRSKGLYFESHKENAIAVLDTWRRRSEIHGRGHFEPNGLEEIIKLLQFHKVLSFFLEDHATKAPRPPWIQPTQWESEFLPLQLSPIEKHRFLRALCRLQVLKNIFGDKVQCVQFCDVCLKPNEWKSPLAEEEEVYRLFYGTMPPWEHEEMGSVLHYLISQFEPITLEIADDLRQLRRSPPYHFFWDILPKEKRLP